MARSATLHSATLILRQATPDAGILARLQRPREALVLYIAAIADLLCLFNLHERGAGISDGKEELRVFVTACGAMSPIRHGSSSLFSTDLDAGASRQTTIFPELSNINKKVGEEIYPKRVI